METKFAINRAYTFLKAMDIRILLILTLSFFFFTGVSYAGNNPIEEEVKPSAWIGESIQGEVEIKLDALQLKHFEILVDGNVYQGEIIPNSQKEIHVYNLGGIGSGTFYVHAWECNGLNITGTFRSGNELAEYLTEMTDSEWNFDVKREILYGGAEGGSYSQMELSKINDTGNVYSIKSGMVHITGSILIELPSNAKSVTVRDFTSGISQTKDFNSGAITAK